MCEVIFASKLLMSCELAFSICLVTRSRDMIQEFLSELKKISQPGGLLVEAFLHQWQLTLLESGDLPSAGGGLRAAMVGEILYGRGSTSQVGFMATTNSPRTANSPGIPWPSLARLLEISMWRETFFLDKCIFFVFLIV